MTAGNDGTPENDDPFAYLYRSEGGEQPEQPPVGGQPGVPRTSHHQVQRVGERRVPPGGYGYPPQAPQGQPGGYGYPPQAPSYDQGQQGYPGQGQQQYAPQGQGQYGGGPTQQYPQQQAYDTPPPGGHRGGPQQDPGAPNRKGLLIAAVAVVAAVAIGIAFAMSQGSGDKNKASDKPSTPVTSTSAPATTTAPPSAAPFSSQKVDASTLALGGGAAQSTEHPGANAAGGTYVDNMATQGASVTWTVTVPVGGAYTFYIDYGNAGADAGLTLAVNGKPRTDEVNLPNYGSYTDWSKAWNMSTWKWVDLKKGANVLSLSCTPLDKNCGVNLDQVWLKQGHSK